MAPVRHTAGTTIGRPSWRHRCRIHAHTTDIDSSALEKGGVIQRRNHRDFGTQRQIGHRACLAKHAILGRGVVQLQIQEAVIAGIEHTETGSRWRQIQVRKCRTVDQHGVAIGLRNHRGRWQHIHHRNGGWIHPWRIIPAPLGVGTIAVGGRVIPGVERIFVRQVFVGQPQITMPGVVDMLEPQRVCIFGGRHTRCGAIGRRTIG